jgi:multicomponent K+:H+ antiporter subunit E
MKKVFPKPILSVLLAVTWCLVQMSVSPGNLIMAALLALVVPLYTTRFWPNAPEIKNFVALFKYILVFLYDVVIANLQVAWWIVMPQHRLRPRFIYVPLEVTHPFVITVLASTISLTPGTVSTHLSGDRKMLIVHALHSEDDDESVRTIKERYEKPLKEIFG